MKIEIFCMPDGLRKAFKVKQVIDFLWPYFYGAFIMQCMAEFAMNYKLPGWFNIITWFVILMIIFLCGAKFIIYFEIKKIMNK